MLARNGHIRLALVALLVFVAACTQGDPTGVTSCDQFGVGCTPEQLRTWEQAEHARINRRAAESATAFDEAIGLWRGDVLFSRDDDDDDDDDGGSAGPLLNPMLIQCEPRRYQGEASIIGPAGGTVKFGPHQLRIPAGALDHWVVITGEIEVSWHVVADLSPEGLTFAEPAILELTLEKCQANTSIVQVAYVDDNLDVISYPDVPPGATNSGKVRAELWHFSQYAVAY